MPPAQWDTEQAARDRGCFDGEEGGWRTLNTRDHFDVILQIIDAFNDLDGVSNPTLEDVRNDIDYWGPRLYPKTGTRAADNNNGNNDPVNIAQRRAAFKGLVSYMDLQMERMTEYVDFDDTYVIFLGDNGSQGGLNGPFDIIEEPNDPARSKATVYRNGREVPFIAAGPGTLKNAWTNELVTVIDLYATVLDIVGVQQPLDTLKSSFSFLDVLKGGKTKRKINVSEIFPSTITVGGLNMFGKPMGMGGRPFGPGQRAVGIPGYSMLAFNRVDDMGVFVCKEGSGTLPENDCLDFTTEIYEFVVDVFFYDLDADPKEDDPLRFVDLTTYAQKQAFNHLCDALNELARESVYYQNGRMICKKFEVSTMV